jgi:hypothetical protein
MTYVMYRSSDDGTCRVWDARTARNPCVYVPGPSDAITGQIIDSNFVNRYGLDLELV